MNTLTTLTVIAISVAAAMTALVLRLVFEERRRSAARVASLEADIYRTEEEDILVLHDPPSLERNVRVLRNPAPPQTLSLAPLVAVFAATAFALFAGVT